MQRAITTSQIQEKMATNRPPISEIQEFIHQHHQGLQVISDSRILVYGGTGFIGKWLVNILHEANSFLDLNLQLTVVSRNRYAARQIFPTAVSIISIEDIHQIPEQSHVIFGATSAVSSSLKDLAESYRMAENAIKFSSMQRVTPKFINLSSGASKFSDANIPFNLANTTYSNLKKEIENLVELETIKGSLIGTNPRLYSFLGPLLALDSKYAAGNFMRNALLGEPITITGNPSTIRTYLYPLELVSKLVQLLEMPVKEQIDIGGTELISISKLAREISDAFGGIRFNLPAEETERTVYAPEPSFNMVKTQEIPLRESIKRWKSWFES
jgi:dTDP-glucose 4,6-dehydratase